MPAFEDVYSSVVRDYPPFTPTVSSTDPNSSLARYKFTFDILNNEVPRTGRVLDVGAWPGVLTTCIKRSGLDVTAVDKAARRQTGWSPDRLLSETWILSSESDALTLQALCSREKIALAELDIEDSPLPFTDDYFDAVVLTEVIEHLWRNPIFVLSEINRVLRTDAGILILSTPNFLSFRNRVNFLMGRIDRVIENPFVAFVKRDRLGHLGHLRLYSISEIQMMLSMLGFECAFLFSLPQVDDALIAKTIQESLYPKISGTQVPSCDSGFRLTRFVKKVFRSPMGYLTAMNATAIEIVEKISPRLRAQMFVVARKTIRSADTNLQRDLEHVFG